MWFLNIGLIIFIEFVVYILVGIDCKCFSLILIFLDIYFFRLIKVFIMGLFLGIFGVVGLMVSVYIGFFFYKIIFW